MLLLTTECFSRINSIVVCDVPKISKLLVIGGVASAGAIFWWYKRHNVDRYVGIGPYPTVVDNPLFRVFQRTLIDKTKRPLLMTWYPLNSMLTDSPVRTNDNGHAKSGAVRDAARRLITNAIDDLGWKKFELSPSSNSYEGGNASMQHYSVGDLHLDVKNDHPQDKSVIVGIDVDYYVHDLSDLLKYELPAVFHTFNPVQVSGIDGDSVFRIVNDEVIYEVGGGGSWKHGVWNWCAYGEYLETNSAIRTWFQYFLSFFGINRVVYHKIHFARPWRACPNRLLVWCLPQYSCMRVSWISTDMHSRKLERVKYSDPNKPGWNTVVSHGDDGLRISLGRAGEDASIAMAKEHFDVLMGLSSVQSVSSRCVGLKYLDPAFTALLGQYYTGRRCFDEQPSRLGRPYRPKVHWPEALEGDGSEQTHARSISTPLVVDEAREPLLGQALVTSNAIENRVTFQANHKIPHYKYANFAHEFVRLVVPEVGVGVPYSMEETVLQLNKPKQMLAVKQIFETIDMEPKKMIECFVKNEPCMKNGRIISSFADVRYLVNFSKFTLKFRDEVLHDEVNRHWFIPGLTPKQIASKVVEYCQNVEEPIEGDFSNFDGTVSAWLQRNVMNAVYHRYFGKHNLEELKGYTDMLVSCPARSKSFGFRYDAGAGVKSGSPTTCDLNTVLTGFMMYCSIRLTYPELPLMDAYRSMGLAFGDDSLFDVKYKTRFNRVASDLGMKLKVERYSAERGIVFLARVYPDPLNTCTSFQDPVRTMRKIHLTRRHPGIKLSTAALDRVEGYLVTDSLTPIISNYCNMIARYYTPGSEALVVRMLRNSSTRDKPYWLTIGGSWPQDEDDVDLMYRVMSARTGYDEETLRSLASTLDETTDPWAALTLKRDHEPTPYENTMDEDGQPVSGCVDQRLVKNIKDVYVERIVESISSQDGGTAPRNSIEPSGEGTGFDRGQRFGRVRELHTNRNHENREGYRKFNDEAPRVGFSEGRTAGRNKQRPGQFIGRGEPAERTAGKNVNNRRGRK